MSTSSSGCKRKSPSGKLLSHTSPAFRTHRRRTASQCVTQQATHLTRLLPPSPWLLHQLGEWDAEVVRTFAAIIDCGSNLTGVDIHAQSARLQLGLSISRGGFVLRTSSSVAPVAYCVSWLSCVSSLLLRRLPPRTASSQLGQSIFSRTTLTTPSSSVTAPFIAAALLLPEAFRASLPQLSPVLGPDAPKNLFHKDLKSLEEEIFQQCLTIYTPSDTLSLRLSQQHRARLHPVRLTHLPLLFSICTRLGHPGHLTLGSTLTPFLPCPGLPAVPLTPCTGQRVLFCGIPHCPRACVLVCRRRPSHPCT